MGQCCVFDVVGKSGKCGNSTTALTLLLVRSACAPPPDTTAPAHGTRVRTTTASTPLYGRGCGYVRTLETRAVLATPEFLFPRGGVIPTGVVFRGEQLSPALHCPGSNRPFETGLWAGPQIYQSAGRTQGMVLAQVAVVKLGLSSTEQDTSMLKRCTFNRPVMQCTRISLS
jgi:hypothetical protein